MATFQHTSYRPRSGAATVLPLIGWGLVIVASALLAGFAASLETKIPAILLISMIAAAGILMVSANSVLWVLLVATLVLTGLVQYFGRINQIQWLPSLLGLMMFIRALVEVVDTRPVALNAAARSKGMPAFVWWFIAFVFLALASNIGKSAPALQIIGGVKNYIAMWGVLILMMVARITPEQLAKLWKGLIAIAFLQFPLVIFQHFFVASKRASLTAGYHFLPWDSVVGTFGGDPEGGGASGALAIFVVIAFTLLLAFWKNALVGWRTIALSAIVVMITIVLGEVKVVLVLLPLAVFLLFRAELLRRPLTLLGGLLVLALSLASITMVYQSLYWDASAGASGRADPLEHMQRAFEESIDPNHLDRKSGEVGRMATLALWWNDFRSGTAERMLGHGFGASRLSPVGAGVVAKRYYPYRVGLTSAASMLWDVGALAFFCYTAALVAAAWTARRLSRSPDIPIFHRAVLESALVAIALIYVGAFYNADLLYLPAMGFMLTIFLGHVAYWYRHSAPSQTPLAPSLQPTLVRR